MDKKAALIWLATRKQAATGWVTIYDANTAGQTITVDQGTAAGSIFEGIPSRAEQLRISGKIIVKTGSGSGSSASVTIYDGVSTTPIKTVSVSKNSNKTEEIADILFDYATIRANASSSSYSQNTLKWNKANGTLEVIQDHQESIHASCNAYMSITKIEAYV